MHRIPNRDLYSDARSRVDQVGVARRLKISHYNLDDRISTSGKQLREIGELLARNTEAVKNFAHTCIESSRTVFLN